MFLSSLSKYNTKKNFFVFTEIKEIIMDVFLATYRPTCTGI